MKQTGKTEKRKTNRNADRRLRVRALKEKRRELTMLFHQSQYNEMNPIRQQLDDLESELDSLYGNHRTFRHHYRRDFQHYYKRLQYSRFVMLFVNVALWGLLFLLSGPATGLRVVIIVLAVITTASNIFELLFLLGIKTRIMTPLDHLTDGVAQIMKGNYSVTVEPRRHSELDNLTEAFNQMARKLESDEKLQEEYEQNRKLLITNISHDLKTPITSIQGYVEALCTRQDQYTPDKTEKYLKIINNNAQYMNKLIDDLFLFSKLDMQKLDFHFTQVDIRRYMADLMEEFTLELSEKQVGLFYCDELETNAAVCIDPKRIHQVIQNIIGNAVKYGPDTGLEIKARLYRDNQNLCLDLKNNGAGIPSDQLDKIFERFYRVDAERTKDTGSTGLGLAIAKELVVAHGGQVSVKSGAEEGTCFTIVLPEACEEGDNHEKHIDHRG